MNLPYQPHIYDVPGSEGWSLALSHPLGVSEDQLSGFIQRDGLVSASVIHPDGVREPLNVPTPRSGLLTPKDFHPASFLQRATMRAALFEGCAHDEDGGALEEKGNL